MCGAIPDYAGKDPITMMLEVSRNDPSDIVQCSTCNTICSFIYRIFSLLLFVRRGITQRAVNGMDTNGTSRLEQQQHYHPQVRTSGTFVVHRSTMLNHRFQRLLWNIKIVKVLPGFAPLFFLMEIACLNAVDRDKEIRKVYFLKRLSW